MPSSSYQHGDSGGAYGDYHAVSHDWVRVRVKSGMRSATKARTNKFNKKMEQGHLRTAQTGNDHARNRYVTAKIASGKLRWNNAQRPKTSKPRKRRVRAGGKDIKGYMAWRDKLSHGASDDNKVSFQTKHGLTEFHTSKKGKKKS